MTFLLLHAVGGALVRKVRRKCRAHFLRQDGDLGIAARLHVLLGLLATLPLRSIRRKRAPPRLLCHILPFSAVRKRPQSTLAPFLTPSSVKEG